jgi:hypothetical protein
MRLSQRSYPHPVVGNGDDVIGSAFQPTIEMTTDKENIYLNVKIICSSETINKAVSDKKANFLIHIECSNTVYRNTFRFLEHEFRVVIPRDDLNLDVEVNTFVTAQVDIPDYRVENAHEDYGDATFAIKAGDILAIGEGYIFPVESDYDSMSRIGSIFKLNESQSAGDQPMQLSFNGDKILILLSKPDMAVYKSLKAQPHLSTMLATIIVMPVLVEALHHLAECSTEDDPRRWVRAVSRKLKSLNIADEVEPIIKAQILLELPFKRSLVAVNIQNDD